MLSFLQWLMEARYQPEEQHSWMWHPFHGVHSETGYMQHAKIMREKPELGKMPKIVNGQETQHDYDPPRGFVRVDRPKQTLHYTRYDQSKYAIPGTADSADASEVDKHIRKTYNVPAHFKSVAHDEPKLWHNSKGFEFKPFR